MRFCVRVAATLTIAVANPLLAQGRGGGGGGGGSGEDLTACRVPGLREQVLCGTYEVYEDRGAATGRKFGLRVVVIPATGSNPAPDPLFIMAGGPGQAASSLAGFAANANALARRDRDIVLVDQRGTGGSNPLSCEVGDDEDLQAYLGPLLPIELVEACRPELEKRADLTLYTTPIAMDDLDDVRAWLGYEQINLYGISYGTRATLVYIRRHGDRVRSAILSGSAPPNFKMPTYYGRDSQRALVGLFEDCAEDDACSAAYPELRDEFVAVLRGLDERGFVTAKVADPRTGEPVTLEMSRDAFGSSLRFLLYSPLTARQIPLFIHRAYEADDYAPFMSVALRVRRSLASQVNLGMFLSVTCAEDLPLVDPEEVRRVTAHTFLGDYRVRQQTQACQSWPRGELPPGYYDPVSSDVPVLIISGELDPVTPPVWGEEVKKHLSNSLHVVVKGGAHSNPFPCVRRLVADFLSAGSVAGLDAACARGVSTPPFLIPSED